MLDVAIGPSGTPAPTGGKGCLYERAAGCGHPALRKRNKECRARANARDALRMCNKRTRRADVGIGPYENIASTAMGCVRRKEHPYATRLARVRVSGQRMAAQRRCESKVASLSVLVRGVGGCPRGTHFRRGRIPKPWVLAAFFGYFLPLLAESAPPEAHDKGMRKGITDVPVAVPKISALPYGGRLKF